MTKSRDNIAVEQRKPQEPAYQFLLKQMFTCKILPAQTYSCYESVVILYVFVIVAHLS